MLKRKGFSLLEILVATVIIGILIGGILTLFFVCLSLNEKSRETFRAMVEAQNILEEIRNRNYDTISGETFPLNDFKEGKCVVSVDKSIPDRLKIKTVVSWLSEKEGRVVRQELTAYLARRM